MNVRRTVLVSVLALVVWFVVATVAGAQDCTDEGWVLAGGRTAATAQVIAHGPLDGWVEGWRYEANGVPSVLVAVPVDGVLWFEDYEQHDGVWSQVNAVAMVVVGQCLFASVDSTPEGMRLYFMQSPDFKYHEHPKVERYVEPGVVLPRS